MKGIFGQSTRNGETGLMETADGEDEGERVCCHNSITGENCLPVCLPVLATCC